jgi:7-cyano-7-deazaguanine synthase
MQSQLHSRALVLFSGGQDSTVCLAWALERHAHVETIGFDYGQRHRIEIGCRQTVLARLRAAFPSWSAKLGADHLLDLTQLGQISDTALTRETAIADGQSGMPNTFVPARNLLFLTYAAAIAYRRGLGVLIGGMCETDYSGYADCRDETMKAMQTALSLGLGAPMSIETPLMWIDKAATWSMAEALGGTALVDVVLEDTHTCYLGDRSHRHAWGYGCGGCPACALRSSGYARYLASKSPAAAPDVDRSSSRPDG